MPVFRKTLLTFIIMVYSCFGYAQIFDWAKGLESNGSSCGAYDIDVDASGYVYVVGKFESEMDFDPGLGVHFEGDDNAGTKGFILKLAPNGNLWWVKVIQNYELEYSDISCQGVELGGNGDIYVCGYYQYAADFDTGPDTLYKTSNAYEDMFVMALNSSGHTKWAHSYGGIGDDYAFDLALDEHENVYVTGSFVDSVDFAPGPDTVIMYSSSLQDAFIQKLDSSGNHIWTKMISSENASESFTIEVEGTQLYIGGFYLANYDWLLTDFDPGPGEFLSPPLNNHGAQIYVLKLDTAGNFDWVRTVGGSGFDNLFDLELDAQGNVIVSGRFSSYMDFDPGPGTDFLSNFNFYDSFIWKLTSDGDYIQTIVIANGYWNQAICLAVAENGDMMISGRYKGMLDLDPGPGINIVESQANEYDVYFAKYDSTGNFLWGGTIANNGWSVANSLNYFEGFGYYAGGKTGYGPCDMNPTLGVDQKDGPIYIIKLNQCEVTHKNLDTTTCYPYQAPSGNVYASSGFYLDTLEYIEGCDSIFHINLTVLNTEGSVDTTACAPFTPPSGNTVYTVSGSYLDTIPNSNGCDSIIAINFTSLNNSSILEVVECESYTVPSGSNTYYVSGVYYDTLQSQWGCDSVLTINLTIPELDTAVVQNGTVLTSLEDSAAYQWVDCSYNYLVLYQETNQTFNPKWDGVYAVVITDNGCSDTSACFVVEGVVGTSEINADQIEIYPNPNKGNFTLKVGPHHLQGHIQLYDIQGKMINTILLNGQLKYDLKLPEAQGIYEIKIILETGEVISKKVIRM